MVALLLVGMALSRDLEIPKYLWMYRCFSNAVGDSHRIRTPAFTRSPRVRIKNMSGSSQRPPELGATSCQRWRCFVKLSSGYLILSIFHLFPLIFMYFKINLSLLYIAKLCYRPRYIHRPLGNSVTTHFLKELSKRNFDFYFCFIFLLNFKLEKHKLFHDRTRMKMSHLEYNS